MDNSTGSVFGSLFGFLIFLAIYVYYAYSLQVMAKKLGLSNLWMAWVPIANTFLLLQIAGKPMWWFILFLIPFINFIVLIVVMIAVSKRMGKSTALGVVVAIIPLLIGLLAFGESQPSPMQTPPASM